MNIDSILYGKAVKFVFEKHKGQFDKSGKDYINHCLVVGMYDKVFDDRNVEYKNYFQGIIGLLHDTLEDTETTYDELVLNFGKPVADHVNMLTRREDMSYMDYINSLKHNEVCRKVKIADLLHNMDLTRLNKITKNDIERNRKYLKALEVLIEMEG